MEYNTTFHQEAYQHEHKVKRSMASLRLVCSFIAGLIRFDRRVLSAASDRPNPIITNVLVTVITSELNL